MHRPEGEARRRANERPRDETLDRVIRAAEEGINGRIEAMYIEFKAGKAFIQVFRTREKR